MKSSKPDPIQKLASLVDEDHITKARKRGDEQLKNLTESEFLALRRRAKHDLYFLCKGVLRYDRLSPNLHGHLCAWHARNSASRFKEELLPRGHYKSTVITVGHSVQLGLTDDDGEAPWPANLGPNCRTLICHEIVDTASDFLLQITGHFLSNPILLGLFPELVPNRKEQRINLSELELPRSENWSEASYSTMGVGGRNQGKHFNYLKLDDLIGDKARDSATEMQRAKDWFDNIQAFFSAFVQDKFDLVGTRWAYDDLYKHVHDTYGSAVLKYIRPAIIHDKDGNPVPLFPEQFTLESFEQIKKNKRVWSAQYANDPREGASLFENHWKRFYTRLNYESVMYQKKVYHVDDMDKVILIDPAMSGKAGIVVTGGSYDANYFILEALKAEWSPPDMVDLIFKLVQKWQPRAVAIEKVLFSGLYEHWLADAMKLRGIYFRVEPITTSNKAKEARVLGLSNYYAAGQIIYHPSQELLIEEHDNFGATDDYHMLDALAQGPQVWRKGVQSTRLETNENAFAHVLSSADPIGGY